jgi:hypothetical protein
MEDTQPEVLNGAPLHLSYSEAREYYRYSRNRAFGRVRDALVSRGVVGAALSIRGFDHFALEAWERDWRGSGHWSLKGGFSWTVLQRRYCKKPRNFHCALWYGEALCGLAVGRLSEGHERLSLHFMEGSPDRDHPLRGNVAVIVFACAELYARAVGAGLLILKNPDPDLDTFYNALGFDLAYVDGANRFRMRAV